MPDPLLRRVGPLALAGALLLPSGAAAGGAGAPWYEHEYEYSYVEVLITIILLTLALFFEKAWHHWCRDVDHSYRYGDFHEEVEKAEAAKDGQNGYQQVTHIEHPQLAKELVTRMGGEFMTLGFLAFCVFSFNKIGGFQWCTRLKSETMHLPTTAEDWLHMTEVVHMQMFLGMILYFMLVSRAVRGGQEKIKLWERMRLDMASGTSARAQADLTDYMRWRSYFVTKMVRWYERRPAVFQDILPAIGVNPTDVDASERFQVILDQEFAFSAYLAVNVSSGICDSIQIHVKTWFVMIILFGFFAVLHRYAHVSLPQLVPGFIGIAVCLLAVKHFVVTRKRKRIDREVVAGLDEGPDGRNGANGENFARTASSVRRSRLSISRQNNMVSAAKDLRFHERHSTEIVMLRVLQIVLFLLSYVFARTIVDTHDWAERTLTTLLHAALFVLLFLILATSLPDAVPMFLGMMALPPYVDSKNLNCFAEVLFASRHEAELKAMRASSKGPSMRSNSGSKEGSNRGSNGGGSGVLPDSSNDTFNPGDSSQNAVDEPVAVIGPVNSVNSGDGSVTARSSPDEPMWEI